MENDKPQETPKETIDGSSAPFALRGANAYDIEKKDAEDRFQLEMLISAFSSALIGLLAEELVQELGLWFKRFAEFLHLDRITVSEFSVDRQCWVLFQSYSNPRVCLPPLRTTIDLEPIMNIVKSRILKGVVRVVEYVPDDMPDAEKFLPIVTDGTKSFVSVPLAARDEILGVLVFAVFQAERHWPEDLVRQLTLIGSIIANALMRKRFELKLLEQIDLRERLERSHSVILQTANMGFIITDLKHNILEVNNAYCIMTGYGREEILSMKLVDFKTGHNQVDIEAFCNRIVQEGSARLETQHTYKDGSVLDLEISANFLPGEGVIFSFFRDITQLKRIQREKEDRLAFEELISKFSAALINFSQNDLENFLEAWIQKLARFLNIDRCDVIEYQENFTKRRLIFSYINADFEQTPVNKEPLPSLGITKYIMRGEPLKINRIPEDLPSDLNPRFLNTMSNDGTKSLLALPLKVGNTIFGSIIFSSFSQSNLWTNELTRRLGLVAEIIANALIRNQADLRLTQYRKDLERLVEDRTAALDDLKESEERFRSIFNSARDGIILSNALTHTIVMGNKAIGNMLDYSEEELLSMKVADIHPDCALFRVIKHHEEIAKGNISVAQEMPVRRKDATIFFADIGATMLKFGGVDHFVGIFRDVTEKKQALAEQQKLVSIIESSSDFIGIFDLEKRVDYINKAGQKLLGIDDMHAVLNSSVQLLYFEGEYRKFETQILPKLLQASNWEGEIGLRHFKTGAAVPVEMNCFIIRDKLSDQPIALACISRDLTARKKAEVEKQALQNQLVQAQKMEAVGLLAGGVAHDFNNMLSVIIGNAEIAMLNHDPQAEIYGRLKAIHSASMHSADLVRQLLAFARKQTIEPKVLDINDAISAILRMLRRLIGEDIDLAWIPGHDTDPVKIDPAQIDQILANLVVNARDAIDGVGKITIQTENIVLDQTFCDGHVGFVPGAYVMLTVGDSGCGMDQATIAQIFQPFFSTKVLGKGTGLGLATVYGIVKQNEGVIDVCSELGKGTSFKIYFPRVDRVVHEAENSDVRQSSPRGTETILLVEDDKSILELGKSILVQLGYTVLSADSPEQAIAMAQAHPGRIDFLLTDVVMPLMNGRELYKRLGEIQPAIKCLYMSGYSANVISHHGVLEGGVNFIQKPFSIYNLAVKVREVLDSGS